VIGIAGSNKKTQFPVNIRGGFEPLERHTTLQVFYTIGTFR
jgi:hypothetical protein